MKIKNRPVFVTSDLHFGQSNFYTFNERMQMTMRPEFKDKDEAEDFIIKTHNAIVPEFESIVYFLGDIANNVTNLARIDEMHGEVKILVGGNHDVKFTPTVLNRYFHQTLGCCYLFNKKYVLTHIPIHPNELRGMINIHGHVHRHVIDDARYISACLETHDYEPTRVFP